jgi:uncharacterized lipoprotein
MGVRFHLSVLLAMLMLIGLAGCDAGPSARKGKAQKSQSQSGQARPRQAPAAEAP